VTAHVGSEGGDDVTDGGGKDIDAPDDQHVVGPSQAADAWAGAAAAAGSRPHPHVVARAEAEERCGPVPEVGEHELPLRAVLELAWAARLRVDELDVDEAARAQVHTRLLLALPEERDADVADPHRLRHPCAPAALELYPKGRLAPAGLAGDENAVHARTGEVHPSLGGNLGEVGGVRRGQHHRLGAEELDRPQEALRVPGPDGDVAEPDAVERREGRAGDERAGVVGGDDALARRDA